MKKNVVGIICAVVILAVCLGLGQLTGLRLNEFLTNIELNLNALLKVVAVVAALFAVKYLIHLLLGLIKKQTTLLSLFKSLLDYAIVILAIIWSLKILGADVGTVVAGMGIVALIVGFGANSLIADMVTGIFMIFENQYNVGDFVEVGGFRGKVTSIGIRTTCLEDAGGNVKIINNSAMTNILNRSDHSSRAVSVIGIPYETDLEALEKKIPALLDKIYEAHQDVMLSKPVYLGVDALAESSVNLKFVVEVNDKNIYSAGRILNHDLFLGMRSVGIEVPFPQVDVHQK